MIWSCALPDSLGRKIRYGRKYFSILVSRVLMLVCDRVHTFREYHVSSRSTKDIHAMWQFVYILSRGHSILEGSCIFQDTMQ